MGAGNSIEGPVVESGYGGRYWERDYDTLSKKYWDALEQSQNLNIQLGSLRTELRNLKAEQATSAADTVPLKDWNQLVADYDKLDEKLELQKKSISGSHLKWHQEKQAHLEKVKQLNADLFTLREIEIPHLKRLQAQKSLRSIREKELLTAENLFWIAKLKASVNDEKQQREKLEAEMKKISEKAVIYQYNRTKIVIENIPFDHSQEEVIDKFLGKGQHLIYWDDNPDMMLRLHDDDSQRCIAYLENVQAAEEIFQKWNGVVEHGRQITVSYSACTKKPAAGICAKRPRDRFQEPKKTDSSQPEPLESKPAKPQGVAQPMSQTIVTSGPSKIKASELGIPDPYKDPKGTNRRIICVSWLPEGVTDATLLLFLPSSEPGYEMKNGRPHTERLRTDKGLIGFIFFETVGKAQECMRMFSKYRPPDLPYGFSYYGNAAHINTLLHKHLSF